MKFSRIESWRQHVVGEQKYPIELTLKKVGPKTIHNMFNKDLLT